MYLDLTHLAATAATVLISATWQAALLAIAVAILLRIIPNLSAALRSLLWTSVFLIATALPFLAPVHTASTSTVSAPDLSLNVNWAIGIAAFWAALSLFRIAQLIRSAIHLSGVARRAEPLHPLPGPRQATLCASPEIDVPCVAGFFTPRVLIPTPLYNTLSQSDLAQIIAHEQAHLARYDDWTNLLQKTLIALYPIHPVLLWIERRLCIERELACDDAVLRTTAAPKQYALCLTHLAERSLARRGFTLALRAWERQSELTRRVLRILQTPGRTLRPAQAGVLVTTVLAALTTSAVTLSHSPQLIRFAAPAPTTQSAATPSVTPLHHNAQPTTIQPTFVNASFHLPPKPVKHLNHQARHNRPAHHSYTTAHRANTGWFTLTTYQSTEAPIHLRQAVYQDANFSYAAFPTRNGWLILQL